MWDHPEIVLAFEEIGRRAANVVGGFPIKVRLVDTGKILRKELAVGRVVIGGKDEIYYYGSATSSDAAALAKALWNTGYIQNKAVRVVLSKGGGTVLSFVVNVDFFERPHAFADFERMTRSVAPSVGGLPVKLRLVDSDMHAWQEVMVQ
jgi:hypothetical protein